MIELLNFIFSSLWTFIGSLILLSAFSSTVVEIIQAVKTKSGPRISTSPRAEVGPINGV